MDHEPTDEPQVLVGTGGSESPAEVADTSPTASIESAESVKAEELQQSLRALHDEMWVPMAAGGFYSPENNIAVTDSLRTIVSFAKGSDSLTAEDAKKALDVLDGIEWTVASTMPSSDTAKAGLNVDVGHAMNTVVHQVRQSLRPNS